MEKVQYDIRLSEAQYRCLLKVLDSQTKRHPYASFSRECEKLKDFLKENAVTTIKHL